MNEATTKFAQRIEGLSTARRRLLARRLGIEPAASKPRLVAYFGTRSDAELDTETLRGYLAARVPEYMMPRVLVQLEPLPRTPAGKIDRKALASLAPEPVTRGSNRLQRPRDEREAVLAEIWQEVLGVSELSVDDDFFELGGDSLLSIRILSRARQRGLQISAEHFFAHPTVAGQAAAAGELGKVKAESGLVIGAAPLTPIQHWFFEHISVEPQHWNQAALFTIDSTLDDSILDRALQRVLLHHDALRTRFSGSEDGRIQTLAEPAPEVPLSRRDLSGIDEGCLGAEIDRLADTVHPVFDLEQGDLLHVVHIRTPSTEADRLLVVAHHLIVDAVSWRILIEDLSTACRQSMAGESVRLPPKTSSIKSWAKRLSEHAGSAELMAEVQWWSSQSESSSFRLPIDHVADAAANRVDSTDTVSVSLDEAATRALLNEVPEVYRTQIMDVLLTALGRVLAAWSGQKRIQLDVEGHGRQPLFDDLDISRTVGWFTTVYPVWLDCPHGDDLGVSLKRVKEQWRQIPGEGMGHGLLRYCSPDPSVRERLRRWPGSQLCFNYLGRFDDISGLFRRERENAGTERSPSGRRAYLLDVNARVATGRLHLDWTFSRRFHRRSTVEGLAEQMCDQLRALIEHCRSPEAGGYTPSDFPLANLDQGELDNLSQLLEQIDDDGKAD